MLRLTNTMANNRIGSKISFWGLISGKSAKNVLIPSIQRDYTYGALTEDTDKVLNNLLNNIKRTLFELQPNGKAYPELTLNFVYGYTQETVNYVPLDGQQRLTTLFLLHYYAALFHEDKDLTIGGNGAESVFGQLERFTYATRETTRNYCLDIIEHHKDILEGLKSEKGLRQAIEDMPWFLPSFKSDPSIRSMQVVIERIENLFKDVKMELWDKLTDPNCPINFYLLNFGPFHLSDDLYVKMNSRGKKLTEYEIFKSQLLKHIEKKLDKRALKRELAIKFDNQWTDLVWETIGRPEEEVFLSGIDEAYMLLMKLILRYLSYLHGMPVNDVNIKLNPNNIACYLDEEKYVKFLESFMDVFSDAQKAFKDIDLATDHVTDGITQIVKRKYAFTGCLKKEPIRNGDCLFLFGIYCALKEYLQFPEKLDLIRLRIRHLRNIIENSDNEIRDEKMPSLIKDVEHIMAGGFERTYQISFNKNQWEEECEKEEHIVEWKQLWTYEEHFLLRGAISSFANGQKLEMGNPDAFKVVIDRLNKFNYIFDDNFRENDSLIRAALLTIDDYSQYLRTYDSYRILGNIPLCWRLMFVKNDMRKRQEVIMTILDRLQIDIHLDVKSYLEGLIDCYVSNPSTEKTDWKYYVIKYRKHMYKAYTHNESYGYFFFGKPDELGKVAILQSSGFGISNVAWYILPLILKERNEQLYRLSLGNHAAREEEESIEIVTNDYVFQLGIMNQGGWFITGLPEDVATTLGITYTKVEEQDTVWFSCKPNSGDDYVEWAEKNILQPLSALPGFLNPPQSTH